MSIFRNRKKTAYRIAACIIAVKLIFPQIKANGKRNGDTGKFHCDTGLLCWKDCADIRRSLQKNDEKKRDKRMN